MNDEHFQAVVKRIRQKDKRFVPEAYFFVKEVLDRTVLSMGSVSNEAPVHVSGKALLEGLRQVALYEFGPLAYNVLQYWGIRTCSDVGQIVYHLVDEDVFGQSESDSIQDFENGYDFKRAFLRPFAPSHRLSKRKGFSS